MSIFPLHTQSKKVHTGSRDFTQDPFMQQLSLLQAHDCSSQVLDLGHIHAVLTDQGPDQCEMLLEISSHKFLLEITSVADQIEAINLISTKSFFEMSKKSLLMVRSLVEFVRHNKA